MKIVMYIEDYPDDKRDIRFGSVYEMFKDEPSLKMVIRDFGYERFVYERISE